MQLQVPDQELQKSSLKRVSQSLLLAGQNNAKSEIEAQKLDAKVFGVDGGARIRS